MKSQYCFNTAICLAFLLPILPATALDVDAILSIARKEACVGKENPTNNPVIDKRLDDLKAKLLKIKVPEWPSSAERFSDVDIGHILKAIVPESTPLPEAEVTPGDPLRFRWNDAHLQTVQLRLGVYADSTNAQFQLLRWLDLSDKVTIQVEPTNFPLTVIAEDEASISAAYRNVLIRLSFAPREFAHKSGSRPSETERRYLETLLSKIYAVLNNEPISTSQKLAFHTELRKEQPIAKGQNGKVVFMIPKNLQASKLDITCLDRDDVVISDRSSQHPGEQVWTLQAKRSGHIRFLVEATNPRTGEIVKEELSVDVEE